MQSIRSSHIHAPKGPNLFAISVGAVFWFSIALLFFLISWAVGGDGFKASIGWQHQLGGIDRRTGRERCIGSYYQTSTIARFVH